MVANAEVNSEMFVDNGISLQIGKRELAQGIIEAAWDNRRQLAGTAIAGVILAHATAEAALGAPPTAAPPVESNALIDFIDMLRNHPSKGIVGLGTIGAIYGGVWGTIQVFQSMAAAEKDEDGEKKSGITLKGAVSHVAGSVIRETLEWASIGGIGALGVNYFDKMQERPFSNEDIAVMMAGGTAVVLSMKDALSNRI